MHQDLPQPGDYIRTYYQARKRAAALGDGVRMFLVLSAGKTSLRLLYIPTLTAIRVRVQDLGDWTHLTRSPWKLERLIRTAERCRESLGLSFSRSGVRRARDLLRQAKQKRKDGNGESGERATARQAGKERSTV